MSHNTRFIEETLWFVQTATDIYLVEAEHGDAAACLVEAEGETVTGVRSVILKDGGPCGEHAFRVCSRIHMGLDGTWTADIDIEDVEALLAAGGEATND